MNKYTHVISLGFFCSTALELERIGLRDASSPFDWLICDLDGVIECIKNDFKDFLKYENIYQHKSIKKHYFDKKYKFHFYHDFSAFEDLKSQLPKVKKKYQRRIERFKLNIQEPTLFIRYIKNQDELDFIEENYENIMSLLKSKNEKNDLVLISNDDIYSDSIKVFKVKKDENDSVSRKFLEKNNSLNNYLSSDIYNKEKRDVNIQTYKSSQRKKKILKYPKLISYKLNKSLKKPYIHNSQIDR